MESVMSPNLLILCHPLLFLSSVFPSIRVFSNESALCIRWLMYWILASASVFPMNIKGWFLLGLTGLIYLHSNELSRVFSNSIVWKMNSSVLSCFYSSTLTSVHDYIKNIALTIWTLAGKVISLPFNILSRLVIAFLPKGNCLLILWLQSSSTVILEPKKIKPITISILFPSICHEVMESDAMTFIFWILSCKPSFSFFSFTFIKQLFSSSWFLPLGWYHLHIWGCWYFFWQYSLCFIQPSISNDVLCIEVK